MKKSHCQISLSTFSFAKPMHEIAVYKSLNRCFLIVLKCFGNLKLLCENSHLYF